MGKRNKQTENILEMPSLDQEKGAQEEAKLSNGSISRRSFLGKGLAAGAATIAAGALPTSLAFGQTSGKLNKGDVAILRFLSAAEILETDLWQQYNELGGIQDKEVPGGSGSPGYIAALQVLDGDMP